MSKFSSLKSSSDNSIERLNKEMEKLNGGSGSNEEEGYWKPTVDKVGNGSAIIRFLPAPAVDGDEALPWQRIYSHGIKGPSGKWYIEKSLTTLNQKDPVSDLNSRLWAESSDDSGPQRKQARDQKRRLGFVSNIMVISDPENPENDGKVFLYKYGKKIFEKIQEAMRPPFDAKGRSAEHALYDPTNAFVPFDMWKGANFNLRIRKKDGFRNYDGSSFDVCSVLDDDDSILENIWKQERSLTQLVAPSEFKTYDELKEKLATTLEMTVADLEERIAGNRPAYGPPVGRRVPAPAPAPAAAQTKADSSGDVFKGAAQRQSSVADIDEDDEDVKRFKELAV